MNPPRSSSSHRAPLHHRAAPLPFETPADPSQQTLRTANSFTTRFRSHSLETRKAHRDMHSRTTSISPPTNSPSLQHKRTLRLPSSEPQEPRTRTPHAPRNFTLDTAQIHQPGTAIALCLITSFSLARTGPGDPGDSPSQLSTSRLETSAHQTTTSTPTTSTLLVASGHQPPRTAI